MTIHVSEEKIHEKNYFFGYPIIIIKLFFSIFLISSILFGIVRIIHYQAIKGIYDGIVFGLLLAIILVPISTLLDLIERLRCYAKFKKVSFRVNQERKCYVRGDYNELFNKLSDIIDSLGFRIEKQNIKLGYIYATAKRSWKSFGEKIVINIRVLSNKDILIKLSSKPVIRTTFLDYCKNFINLEIIIQKLKENGAL